MNKGLGIFSSRFARRLYIVFILSAILPVLLLAAISFNRVTDQLLAQNQTQQQQEVKAQGLSIYERLTLLEAELRLIESRREFDSSYSFSSLAESVQRDIQEKFVSIGWMNSLGHYDPLLKPTDAAIETIDWSALPQSSTQYVIVTTQNGGEAPHLFMIRNPNLSERGETLVAELNGEYVWSPDTIESDQGLCVLDQSSIILFCSQSTPPDLIGSLGTYTENSFAGNFEWRSRSNELLLVSYWGIFLQSQYGVGDWTTLVHVPRDQVIAPVTNFQTTFALIFLISLLVVLLLSSSQIRRILTPLRKLTTGIQEFGNTNFESRVIIESRDEFQDLAESFNDMGVKLADQFQSLETMAEIDRLILSSQDSENIVQIVLVRIQDIIGCDQIGIAAQNNDGEFKKMYIRARTANLGEEPEIQEAKIDLTHTDHGFLKEHRDGVIVELDHTAPLFLESLVDLGGSACLVLPLFIDDNLSAIVALAYSERPDNAERLLEDTRSWADRVGVALSNAKWQEKLYHQANYDALTGLPNRPAFRTYLQQAINRAKRNEEMVGVLFIDLDRFKLVNDTMGHAAGDEYLKEIAERLSLCVRSTDMLARLGGDEFTIVVSENPDYHHIKTSISAVAEKLLGVIPLPIDMEGQEVRSTASIGISIYPLDADNIEDLMRNADSAMYHAKANGGGIYHYYSEELNQAITEQLRVENELRYAIQNDQLELYYQPQVDARTERVVGAEALLRWNHPKANLIVPDDFIPIAEETNLIIDIDDWVLNAACSQLKKWKEADYPEIRIAVNLSGRFFQQEKVVDQLKGLIEKYGIEPRLLELEITEGTLIEDIDAALERLRELRELEFVLTIDDFGTGYSSLSYLKRLPIDKLKIDQAFVQKCVVDPVDNALVKTIINMAHNLNMECIAEGVELDEQLKFLRKEKCNEIQGFYYSRPLPIRNFEARYMNEEEEHADV